MKTELEHGYTLELYEKFNYGTVKMKYFIDMLDVVTFTNRMARRYIDYCICLIDKTNDIELYSGCIHKFNVKVARALLQFDLNNC